MKKHISVFQLMVRCNFYRVLAVLAVMIVLQTGLFWFALNCGIGAEGFGLEYVFEKSYIELVSARYKIKIFRILILLICILILMEHVWLWQDF